MNPAQLLQHFDRMSDAPDAVLRLRRFILDLAVRGKLVEQDPKDEPASELLRGIQAEKARLVEEGEINKQDELPPPGPSEVPFEVPSSWAWIRIGSAAHVEMGQSPPSEHYNQSGDGIPFFQGKADFGVRHPTPRYWCTQPTKIAKAGDILISVRAPVGPTNVASQECCIGRGLAALRPYRGVDTEFFLISLKSCESTLESLGFGTTFVAINKKQIVSFAIPLPPLAEQHSIVAKVDELMALCDRLEKAQAERETRRDRLVAASLQRLNNGDDAQSFREHVRFHLRRFPRLTTRPEHIQQLRQTILSLAVRGQLVPQDPNDEPASELLKRIQAWRSEAIAAKKVRLPRKALSTIEETEIPFQLPMAWSWTRLGELIYIHSGDSLTAEAMKDGPIPVFGGNGIAGFHDTPNIDHPTVVIGRVGYYCGSIHVTPQKAWITDNAFITEFCSDAVLQSFLVLLLKATNLKENEKATAQPVISGSKIYPIVVALPPLAEQHRIVAKVDELLAVCERLEVQLATAQSESSRLLEALLHQAFTPAAV